MLQLDELERKLATGEIVADEKMLELLDKLKEEKEDEKKEKIKDKRHQELLTAVSNIKIPKVEIPPVEVTIPPVEVIIPPIEVPQIPTPIVSVNTPEEVKISKPSWLPQTPSLVGIVNTLRGIKTAITAFRLPTDPENPVAVRLSDGKEFYKAIQDAYKGISNFRPVAAYRSATGNEENGLIDDDRHVQVDILSQQEAVPTASTQNNPSYTLTRNGSGYITSVAATIAGTTYTKTITRDGSNYIASISSWV